MLSGPKGWGGLWRDGVQHITTGLGYLYDRTDVVDTATLLRAHISCCWPAS